MAKGSKRPASSRRSHAHLAAQSKRSRRRIEPDGSAARAPQLRAASALALLAAIEKKTKSSARAVIKEALRSEDACAELMHQASLVNAYGPDVSAAWAFMVHHRAVAKKSVRLIDREAKKIEQKIRTHAGSGGRRIEVELPLEPLRDDVDAGAWLDGERTSVRTPRAPPRGRAATLIARLGVDRCEGIAPHAVVTLERSESRRRCETRARGVAKETAPTERLRAAFFHADVLPTALRERSDHYYLPMLGRWVSAAEMARLFQIPEGSALGRAWAAETGLDETGLVEALGAAIFVPHMVAVLRLPEVQRALAGLATVVYVSACSGVDSATAALDVVLGDAWRHGAASEKRPEL